MSCEGNRHQFFLWASEKYGLKEKELEKIYQTAKARGPQDDAEKTVQAHKTRLLFGAMRSLGIKPPTHSPSGLPKANSCSGYAEISDLLNSVAQTQVQENDFLADDTLTDGEGYYLQSGYHKKTRKNRQGYSVNGYMESGEHIWFGSQYANQAFGFHHKTEGFQNLFGTTEKEIYDEEWGLFLDARKNGVYPDGYDYFGFDADGYSEVGLDHYGFQRGTQVDYQYEAAERMSVDVKRIGLKNPKLYKVDVEGFAEDGFMPRYEDELEDKDRLGYTRKGFRKGRSWTGYDEMGLDAQGNARPNIPWYDAWGYNRKTGLTEPDAQGKQYNLIGWEYDPKTDTCFNPQNPEQKIKHKGSWRYSGKYKKVIMVRSYVPDQKELIHRLKNPRIRMSEVAQGSDLYRFASIKDYHVSREGRDVTLMHHLPSARYLRSKIRAKKHPDAAYLGIRLRCSKCGRFTGAKAHRCPDFGNQEVIQFSNGIVAAWKPVVGVKGKGLDLFDELHNINIPAMPIPYDEERKTEEGDYLYRTTITSWLGRKQGASLVVLETPFRKKFDPEFEGGPLPGYSYKTGLDKNGHDLHGFNPITGKNKHGDDFKTVVAVAIADKTLKNQMDDNGRDPGSKVLVETYSRIASAMAGAPRRVILEEKGGPRNGMFSTNMKGTIHAERYPLGKDAFAMQNLLAMKAGIYHELGHEEDTDPSVWARVLKIAKGEEEVEGLPKRQARMVAEIYNIIEDGRMERLQAQRRRGIAAVLAADAKINPRWGESVGENVPLIHQVTGMMLYRSLPFFRVRREVFEQASPRAQQLFQKVAPLVDRGTSGSAEDGLFAAVEVSRILAQDEEYKKEQEQQQQAQGKTRSGGSNSGGGQGHSQGSDQSGSKYFIISSAMSDFSGQEVNGAKLPAPGRWGGSQKDEDEKKGRSSSKKKIEDEQGRFGRPKKVDEEISQGKAGGFGSGTGDQQGLRISSITPEPDEDFFFGISERTDLMNALATTSREILSGISNRKKTGGTNKFAGQKLLEPLESLGNFLEIQLSDGTGAKIHTPKNKKNIRIKKTDLDKLSALDTQAQEVGKRFAQRLERLRASIRQRSRHQIQGRMDRRRFKRAVAGSRAVYQQTKEMDITSLAVGISVDMSGSMEQEIRDGKLFGSVSTISAAMDKLKADYMVSAFGSDTVLLKTIGDKEYPLKERGKLSTMDLGGTRGAPSMVVNTIGLSQSKAANKLQFVLSDGDFSDTERMQAEVANAQKQGILPFGIYLGKPMDRTRLNLDAIYGSGNWVSIEHLDDLSKVVAGRIERIYRRLLATR